jgi:hypothetical protein
MSDQFAVNEVAVFQNSDSFKEFIGEEVIVDLPLGWYDAISSTTNRCVVVWAYGISLPDGQKIFATPFHLRKKRPPASDKGERRIMELFVPVRELEPA